MTTSIETKAPFRIFEVKPQLLESGKTSRNLARGEVLSLTVQVVADGGETNLHAHAGNEAIWLVLNGRATFYTTGNEVVGTIGRYQAMFIPHGTPYWFESSSPENLVILRIGARVPGVQDQRIDYSERRWATSSDPSEGLEKRVPVYKEGVFFGD